MTRCPSCSARISPSAERCPSCETPLPAGATKTVEVPGPGIRAPGPEAGAGSSVDGGRFVPGTVLAGRYRVSGLLGVGGMGEVYRAEDLKLGEAVALKFLPDGLHLDGAALARLHREVRLARRIAHRSVCRVYDIGETGGLHYVTMELIDGEDLASLLRRIGRLPKDKAVELSRQICVGLAAAHDAGILHRDLKPSNIMVDGEGRARISDFGLASLEAETGDDVFAGTPEYMAPEQLERGEVSTRSDLYALGLVLYEMFTGRKPFPAAPSHQVLRQRRDSRPEAPSSHVEGLDPVIEAQVLRCLEPDPEDRPATALEVAAGLPGGDPLKAALEAGETPSPEMVAAAPRKGTLRPRTALTLLAVGVAAFFTVLAHEDRWTLIGNLDLEKPPVVLEERAEEILASLGYETKLRYRASGFQFDWPLVLRLFSEHPSDTFAQLDPEGPAVAFFFLREEADPFLPGRGTRIESDLPPPNPVNARRVRLDPSGRLVALRIAAEPQSSKPGEVDWSSVFALAGLDLGAFEPRVPQVPVPVQNDLVAAWSGTYRGSPVTIYAAALGGRPVLFEILEPWDRGDLSEPFRGFVTLDLWIVFFLLLAAGGILAARNVRLGRGDRRGAGRLALFFFGASLIASLTPPPGGDPLVFFQNLFKRIEGAASTVAVVWVLYLALEPFLRRYRPHAVVSWNRLLAGRWKDPMVGRDLLWGFVSAGVFLVLWGFLRGALHTIPPLAWRLDGAAACFRSWISWSLFIAVVIASALLLLDLLVLRLVRRQVLSTVIVAACFLALSQPGSPKATIMVSLYGLGLAVVARKLGFLALVSWLAVQEMLMLWPHTLDVSSWYFENTVLALVLAGFIGVGGCLRAMGSQRLLPAGWWPEAPRRS